MAGHIAHNLFHLLAEGKSVIYTVSGLFGVANDGGPTALAGSSTIRVLHYVILAAGIAASL